MLAVSMDALHALVKACGCVSVLCQWEQRRIIIVIVVQMLQVFEARC